MSGLEPRHSEFAVSNSPSSPTLVFSALLALPLLVTTCFAPGHSISQAKIRVRVPDPDIGVDTLPGRKQAQLAASNQYKVFHKFQFVDRVKQSGITFVHSEPVFPVPVVIVDRLVVISGVFFD